MRVIGTFTDLDRPDHFVWLRGFADMAARRAGLESFYGGAVWARHRSAANATMIDASDVRLLRYARPTWALVTPAHDRPRARQRRSGRHRRCTCSTSAPCARRSTPPGGAASSASCCRCWWSAARRPAPCSRPSRRRTTIRDCRCAAARTSSPGSRAMPTPTRPRAPASVWRARRAGARSCCRACSPPRRRRCSSCDSARRRASLLR